MRWIAVGATIFCALICGSCSIIESDVIASSDQSPPAQGSGSYFLPKQVLHVQLTRSAQLSQITVTPNTIADGRAHFQVGLDLSPTSDDNIQIDYDGGMLKSVSADANDRTGEILVNFAKDVAQFRTTAGVVPGQRDLIADFDPFDYREAMRTNAGLGAGNCVEVELSPGVWSPGCGKYSLARGGAGIVDQGSEPPRLPATPGLYYRRAIPHMVHSVVGGQTVSMENKLFANNSPVLKIDVNRTLFVDRKTTLQFDKGELTQVIVKKDSELLAISKLPVDIVAAYTGEIVTSLTQQKSIVDAQTSLINAQANALNANTSLQKALASTATPASTTASLLAGAALQTPGPLQIPTPGGDNCLGGLAASGTCN